MKKLTSLLFAMVSTMFLAVGATRAAEKFDVTNAGSPAVKTDQLFDVPGLPCVIGDDGP